MRPLGREVGDDARLRVAARLDVDARLAACPRAYAVGADHQPRANRLSFLEANFSMRGVPRDGCRARRSKHVDARVGAQRGDQRRVELAILDDPGERALAELIGVEAHASIVVAEHFHRLDRRHALGGETLPHPAFVQEFGAARTDRVDARIPPGVVRRVGGGDAAAVDDRDREPRARQRDGEREPHETRADDRHVVLHVGRHSASMTWFWLV